MSQHPISLIIPAFNAAEFLAQALDSARAQHLAPAEIIVVDDGSSDDTALIARARGDARVISRANGGPALARNTGLEAARGEIIAFLDADDLWPPDKLSSQSAILAADPDCQLVLGRSTAVRYVPGEEAGANHMMGDLGYAPLLGSALFRRAVFDRVGGFDPALAPAEDVDWFLRAREARVATRAVAHATLYYRVRPGSLTTGVDAERRNLIRAVKRSLDRRRASGPPASLPANAAWASRPRAVGVNAAITAPAT
jgi:glycosyltransferase involved in cell wall biosynthesis